MKTYDNVNTCLLILLGTNSGSAARRRRNVFSVNKKYPAVSVGMYLHFPKRGTLKSILIMLLYIIIYLTYQRLVPKNLVEMAVAGANRNLKLSD